MLDDVVFDEDHVRVASADTATRKIMDKTVADDNVVAIVLDAYTTTTIPSPAANGVLHVEVICRCCYDLKIFDDNV